MPVHDHMRASAFVYLNNVGAERGDVHNVWCQTRPVSTSYN